MSDLMMQHLKRVTDLSEVRGARIAALEAQNKKLVEGLQLLSEYKNYATEGNVETSGGVVHVSEFAAALLSEVTQ